MATGSKIDLLVAVNQQRREARNERARAMDAIVDLLLERAMARDILTRWCTMEVGSPASRAALVRETLRFLEETDATGGEGRAQATQADVPDDGAHPGV